MSRPVTANQRPKTVFFIGSGPGDPELVTVKGKRFIEDADIIIYAGSLIKERVLQYAEKDAEIYNSAGMTLGEIMAIMVNGAKDGKKVVRLHSGDPTLYSALKDEMDILKEEDVPYEIVPGVNSAFASAASLKEELTMPGVTQTVIFTRLEGNTPVPEKERLSLLAKHQATMCIFLSVGMIEKVVEELKHGYPEDTPVAVVHRATWEDEKIIRGTLKDIAKKVKGAKIKRQAMIIVGNVLSPYITHHPSRLYDKDFEHGYRKRRG